MKPHLRINPIPKKINTNTLVISGSFSSEVKEIKCYRETMAGLTQSVEVSYNGKAFKAVLTFQKKGKYIVEIGGIHKVWSWKMGLLVHISVGSDTPVSTKPMHSFTQVEDSISAEKLFLTRLNELRKSYNITALKSDAKLVKIAREHSIICSQHNIAAHNTPWDKTPKDRAIKIGYLYIGENISFSATPEGAINGLFESIAHRAGMLNPSYTSVGVGVARWKRGFLFTINYHDEALYYYTNKQFEKSLEIMKQRESVINNSIWNTHPKTIKNFYKQIGWLYFKMKSYRDALTSFKKAASIDNKDDNILLGAAWSYYKLEEFESAIKFFTRVIKIKSGNENAKSGILSSYSRIAYNYYKSKNYDKALLVYNMISSNHPDNISAINMAGWCYYKKKDFFKALNYFKKALIKKPGDNNIINAIASSLSHIAYNHYKDKNYKNALIFYNKALNINPNDINILRMIGWCYYQTKDYNKAIASFSIALAKNKSDKNALSGIISSYLHIAYDFYNQKKYANAVSYYKKSLNISNENISALRMLGWTYYKMSEFSIAKEYFIKALKVNPDDANSKTGLNAANRKLNS
jgi:tetratricopeptide (TPR) repeat protein